MTTYRICVWDAKPELTKDSARTLAMLETFSLESARTVGQLIKDSAYFEVAACDDALECHVLEIWAKTKHGTWCASTTGLALPGFAFSNN